MTKRLEKATKEYFKGFEDGVKACMTFFNKVVAKQLLDLIKIYDEIEFARLKNENRIK